jgi:hypothetical protein
VLTSPARLHMRLLFTEHTTRRLITMGHLPLLPIVLDYRDAMWYRREHITLALENPSRVCGIALTLPDDTWYSIPKVQLADMNQHFPALENLEFDCLGASNQPFAIHRHSSRWSPHTCNVSNLLAISPHSYPKYYCVQRPSLSSRCVSTLTSFHHFELDSPLSYKACLSCVASIWKYGTFWRSSLTQRRISCSHS